MQLLAMLRREAAKDNGKGQYGSVGRCCYFGRTWSCLGLLAVGFMGYLGLDVPVSSKALLHLLFHQPL